MQNFLIGADPELFVTNGKSYVSAHDLLPGTKSNPFPVAHGAVQVDGTAAEFNIEPARTEREFVRNINTVQRNLNKIIKAKDKQLKLIATPCANYDPQYFEAIPPEAKVLGCDPDFNAYMAGLPNPIPDNNATFRTGSGHVHVGWTNGAPVNDPAYMRFCCQITKVLDIYLGVPSLLWDRDKQRRKLYGKAGAFRPKHYGLEYRVLSNAWLRDPRLIKWVFRTVQLALKNEANNDHGDMYDPLRFDAHPQQVINEKDYQYVLNDYEWSDFIEYSLPPLPSEYLE